MEANARQVTAFLKFALTRTLVMRDYAEFLCVRNVPTHPFFLGLFPLRSAIFEV